MTADSIFSSCFRFSLSIPINVNQVKTIIAPIVSLASITLSSMKPIHPYFMPNKWTSRNASGRKRQQRKQTQNRHAVRCS